MITIKQETLNEETISRLIELSQEWVDEDSCFGMVTNSKDDLKEPLFLARLDNHIIGYVFGHFYVTEKKTSYIPVGAKCFEVDELFVSKKYRNQGIGKRLFKALENHVKDDCLYITLATSNKDYVKVLNFYQNLVGMTFHSAFLIKDTKEKDGE